MMRLPIGRDWVPPFVFIVGMLVVWELLATALAVPEYVLPSPTRIVAEINENVGDLLRNTFITLGEAVLGFAVANVLALLFAVVFCYSPFWEKSLYPYMVALKSVPIVALAPLVTLWLGEGLASKVAMAAMITFFPMVVNATVGLKSVDADALDLMRSLSATERQTLFKLRFPNALPNIFAALKISAPLAVVGAIVAELVAATSGIGYLILIAAYRVETALLFSCVVFASLAGLAFFGAVVAADWFVCRRRRPLPDSGASDADVKQIWFDIRAGRQISEELAKRLNRFGIEKLRQGAKEEDFDYIGRLAGSDRPAVRALAFSLLHNFTKRNDRNALDLLKREWETVENVPEADRFAERMQLMWQMLDAPELEIDWHWRIYDFVAANWDAWQRRTLNWAGWGNPDLMLERAVQRLNDPEYPKSKAWAYLLYATLSPDKRSAVALAEEYLESRHPVTRYIADNIVRSGGDFNPNLSEKRRSTA